LRIDYKTFTFTLEAKDIILLPSFKGSTLRGGFGNAFRRVVCALRKEDCSDCILKEKCVYSYVFETPPPSDTKIMTKYTNAPHPFVIEPPLESTRVYTTGEEIRFNLILIGKAIDYLPYFVYTFDELGKMGIGKDRGKYLLNKVSVRPSCSPPLRGGDEGAGELIYDFKTKTLKSFKPSVLNLEFARLNPGEAAPLASLNPESEILNLSFITPTRLMYDSHFVFDLEFHILIRQLLRRVSLLGYFHCGVDPAEIDFQGIIRKAEDVQVKKRAFRWYDWERYSARQDTRMKMGGFVGDVTFEGDIAPFMPLIKAGEVLHVGKGTGFGLGKYEIK